MPSTAAAVEQLPLPDVVELVRVSREQQAANDTPQGQREWHDRWRESHPARESVRIEEVISGGTTSTLALEGSTEQAQF